MYIPAFPSRRRHMYPVSSFLSSRPHPTANFLQCAGKSYRYACTPGHGAGKQRVKSYTRLRLTCACKEEPALTLRTRERGLIAGEAGAERATAADSRSSFIPKEPRAFNPFLLALMGHSSQRFYLVARASNEYRRRREKVGSGAEGYLSPAYTADKYSPIRQITRGSFLTNRKRHAGVCPRATVGIFIFIKKGTNRRGNRHRSGCNLCSSSLGLEMSLAS